MVRIVSDSTCDLSDELLERYHVTLAPLHILLGGKEFRDRVDITPEEIYEWSDAHKTTPKTSATSIGNAMDLIRPIAETKDEMLIFTISGKMSTTASTFRIAAKNLRMEDRVAVVDSENLSTGIGLLVIEAAIMANNGKPLEEITREMERLKPLVRTSFVVDTLTYLRRGGRCSNAEALAGDILRLHPKIVVKDGIMEAEKKYRGKMSSVIMKYVRDLEGDWKDAKKDRVFITHSGCPEEIIGQVRSYLETSACFEEILVTRAGGVISSHCGPGTLGVLYLMERDTGAKEQP